jgi:hypothetical protein
MGMRNLGKMGTSQNRNSVPRNTLVSQGALDNQKVMNESAMQKNSMFFDKTPNQTYAAIPDQFDVGETNRSSTPRPRGSRQLGSGPISRMMQKAYGKFQEKADTEYGQQNEKLREAMAANRGDYDYGRTGMRDIQRGDGGQAYAPSMNRMQDRINASRGGKTGRAPAQAQAPAAQATSPRRYGTQQARDNFFNMARGAEQAVANLKPRGRRSSNRGASAPAPAPAAGTVAYGQFKS